MTITLGQAIKILEVLNDHHQVRISFEGRATTPKKLLSIFAPSIPAGSQGPIRIGYRLPGPRGRVKRGTLTGLVNYALYKEQKR